jgi:hypothetical protein
LLQLVVIVRLEGPGVVHHGKWALGVLEECQQQLEVPADIDVDAGAYVVCVFELVVFCHFVGELLVDLTHASLLELDSVHLLQALHPDSVELGVVHDFPAHSLPVEEFKELLPRDLL